MTLRDRLISFWRACARTKTGKITQRRDLANARVYTIFGAVNVAIFDFLPTAVFLLAPHVTSYVTGPSAILSVAIAAVAAILSGFSFLDLRCRLWKSTTSTQDAIYCTGSEVSSFAVAWSSTAKSVALTSALVRGCSQSLNYLMGQRLTVLSLSLFSWVPTPRSHVVDVLGFMVCMVVWALVALRLVLRPSRMVLVGFSLIVVAVIGVLTGAAVMVFEGENWNGVEKFFPEAYTGVLSGAAIFYLSFTVFDRLSSSIEYSSPKSIQLHLRSSLLVVAIMGLFLAGSSTITSSMSSRSNLTTEQPLSEAFEASGSSVWTKYLVCVASMLFLTPSIFVQFERSVETVEDLARDGLIGRTLVSEDGAQERSVVVCLVLGCLCALGCAALSIVTLCELAAVGALVEHLVVIVTVLAIRFRADDAGNGTDEGGGGVGAARDARRGDGGRSSLPGFIWIKETGKEVDSIEEGEDGDGESGNGEVGNGEVGNGEVGKGEVGNGEVRNEEVGNEKDGYGEGDEVEASENDRGYKQLSENLGEEFGEVKTGEEQPKIDTINRLDKSPNSSPSPSPSETQSSTTGATEDSSSTTGDCSVSSGSVPSSTETGEIHPIPSEQSLIPSKSIVLNSFENEDSATDTDIDAIVDEYLRSRHDFLHPNPISPSNPPQPTQTTYRKARLSILLYVTSCLAFAAILAHAQSHVTAGHPVWIVAMVISIAGLLVGFVWLNHQPEEGGESGEEGDEKRLRVRNLSLIYVSAILVVCTMLVTQQDVTSAVFGIWSALGLIIYVICGVRRSAKNPPPEGHLVDEATSLLTTTSSPVCREDKRRHRKSFIFEGDLFNESSSTVP